METWSRLSDFSRDLIKGDRTQLADLSELIELSEVTELSDLTELTESTELTDRTDLSELSDLTEPSEPTKVTELYELVSRFKLSEVPNRPVCWSKNVEKMNFSNTSKKLITRCY